MLPKSVMVTIRERDELLLVVEYVKLNLYIEGILDIMSHRQCGVGESQASPSAEIYVVYILYRYRTPTAPTRASLLVILQPIYVVETLRHSLPTAPAPKVHTHAAR
jgi:hypothetical protein